MNEIPLIIKGNCECDWCGEEIPVGECNIYTDEENGDEYKLCDKCYQGIF